MPKKRPARCNFNTNFFISLRSKYKIAFKFVQNACVCVCNCKVGFWVHRGLEYLMSESSARRIGIHDTCVLHLNVSAHTALILVLSSKSLPSSSRPLVHETFLISIILNSSETKADCQPLNIFFIPINAISCAK